MTSFKGNKNLNFVSPLTNVLEVPGDTLALLKSMQSFSSEIRLDKLLNKLLVFFLQITSSERGLFIMKEHNTWVVKTEGSLYRQQMNLSRQDNLETRQDVPFSLIDYVRHTQKSLIIQSEHELSLYNLYEPYLSKIKPQSLLVLPISYQGQIRSLLFLENQTARHVVAQSFLQNLELLTSQAAILLENASLYYQATHDSLTGLANRNLLYQFFEHGCHQAKRYNKLIAILFLDMDNFKHINDTFGHIVGDRALIFFSEQIKTCLREGDLAVRLGGDEFIIMLENLGNISQAKIIVERLLHLLTQPVLVDGHNISLNASIGISVYPQDSTDIQDLLKFADYALYRVKEKRKGHYLFYSSEFFKSFSA